MPKGSKRDRLARVRELAAFDQRIVSSFAGTHTSTTSDPSSPVDSNSSRVPETFADESNPMIQGNRLVVHSRNDLIAQSPSPLLLAGFDEAGRGALAGPVVVGCVHFPFFSATARQSASASPSVHDASVDVVSCLCDNVADELPHYEIEAKPPVARGGVVSTKRGITSPKDLTCPVEAYSTGASNVVSNTPNRSQEQSSNHPMAQSLTHSISEYLPDPLPPQPLNSSILHSLSGLDDSKRLTARQREMLCPRIKSHAVWGIGIASAKEIDELGIVPAVSLAARRAYRAMGVKADLLFCDRGIRLLRDLEIERLNHLTPQTSDFSIPQSLNHSITQSTELAFTRGDSRSLHIAAASIIAKVARDRMMVDLDHEFSDYGFAKHKGYGTAAHIAVMRKIGPSAVHRKTFHVK